MYQDKVRDQINAVTWSQRLRSRGNITAVLVACSLAAVFDGCSAGKVSNGNGFENPTSGSGGSGGGSGTGGSGMSSTTQSGGTNGLIQDDGLNEPLKDAGNTAIPHDCVGLECQQTSCKMGSCQQKACAAGGKTTVHGTVFDPAGKVPLYNVVVYVPKGEVKAFTPGATCDRCGSEGVKALTSALTDTKGNFVLDDVPVGANIPLVMQVGRWRRQIKIPNVTACSDLALTDKDLTRLPRKQSEGDIPLIAITTGGADSMECLPRRMGIDDSEFSTEAGKGRIHLYGGGDNTEGAVSYRSTKEFDTTLNSGAALSPATSVWADTDHLKKYDLVIMSCEGAVNAQEKPASALKAMYDYQSLGGRVFASHWHRYWFTNGPAPVPTIATWRDGTPDPESPTLGTIDTSFPKGKALSEWLVNVGASMTAGQLNIFDGRENVQAVNPALATQWITIQSTARSGGGGGGVFGRDSGGGGGGAQHQIVEYLSFNAPIGVPEAQQCGRAVFNDLHVSTSSETGKDSPGQPFPVGCQQRDLTPQEKTVEFLLFDLSACLQPDSKAPEPPVIN